MKRHNQISQLVSNLQNFSRNEHNLNGLSSPACFDVLACQIIDSIRRIRYVETLALRTDYMTPLRKEPNSDVFDPLWICPYISRHLLSLNPLQARCRRYSRGER